MIDKSQKCVKGSNGCNRGAGGVSWFTNFTVVPEATLEEDMYAQAPRSSHAGLHPWNSPGFAPTHGNGCGVTDLFGLQVQALYCSNPCLGSQQG